MTLSAANLSARQSLKSKLDLLGQTIKKVYPFGRLTREGQPKEYFAGLVLNKFYSFEISLENTLLHNDVFMSLYLYRYVYELHIKAQYIFSSALESECLKRLNEFFEGKDLTFRQYLEDTPSNAVSDKLKEQYISGHYKEVSRFVHPNYPSLKLSTERTDDQQFKFLAINIWLTIWHISEILRLFRALHLLNLDAKLSAGDINSLQEQ